MTRIFLNEREIPQPPLSLLSLDDVLKHVEHSYLAPNDVIRQIQLDGLPVQMDESGEIPSHMLGGIDNREKVEITTGTLQEIAYDSAREAISYLDRIETVIPSLASSFQVFPDQEAFVDLKDLFTGFYWLNMLLDRLRQSNKELLQAPLPEFHQRFASVLEQLIESQERGDFVLVADLLEYELLPLIPGWREIFIEISRKIEVAQII